jgi:hypothetical protein
MSFFSTPPTKAPFAPPAPKCARCDKALTAGDRLEAGGRHFCRACFEALRAQLHRAADDLSKDVNYPMAAVGALLGGVLGIVLWWGFTVVTNIALGLVAMAIGYLVGQGASRFAGGKRAVGLQLMAVGVAVASFLVASYLVNMTFINRELARRGAAWHVPFPPSGPAAFYHVIAANFGLMDVVFLAIVVWEAWIIPRPLAVGRSRAA